MFTSVVMSLFGMKPESELEPFARKCFFLSLLDQREGTSIICECGLVVSCVSEGKGTLSLFSIDFPFLAPFTFHSILLLAKTVNHVCP